jgi:hypothetical protein
MPIQEEESSNIFSEQEECSREIQDDSTAATTDSVPTTLSRIHLIPPPSIQGEIFSQFQSQELSNLTIPARRRRRPQHLCKDINNTNSTNSTNSTNITDNTNITNNTDNDESTSECSTSIVVDNIASVNTVNTALVHRPHSDFALTVDRVTTASRAGLDLAGICTVLAFEAAKLSTRASLGIARTVTGVMSDRLVQAMSKDGNSRYVSKKIFF